MRRPGCGRWSKTRRPSSSWSRPPEWCRRHLALGRLLGHDPELIEHRPLAELASDADRAVLTGALERASRGATVASPVTVVVRLRRHASDQAVPFELTIVNLLDDPTVGGFLVSAHDITARAAAELELRHALSVLTATLNSTADGILVVGADGRTASYNGRFVDMWDIPPAVLESGDDAVAFAFIVDQLVEPEVFEAKVRQLLASPEAESHDTLEFKDGRVFERYSRPQRLDGTVVGRVWSFRDVTASHRADQELRESEQRFRRVFKEGPLPIAVVDLDLRITNVNNALCRFVDRTRPELVGTTFESFTHPDDIDKDTELNWQIGRSGPGLRDRDALCDQTRRGGVREGHRVGGAGRQRRRGARDAHCRGHHQTQAARARARRSRQHRKQAPGRPDTEGDRGLNPS